ncbi:transmembrane protein 26 [Sabethes cyaneus]|uniref:transmembrane protein 26 n=1 Tax=Sabethes cyaneus TaxID=53552 RepID=UPI00237E7C96|nr:transmembrane protein 26 [Sabethes cyaneus]
MAKLLATIKAIITRIIFSTHGFIAIWQVTQNTKDPLYWCLCTPIGVLFIEGIFTLAIKKNQEWRWFCPSVFIYLSTIVPAIWLLELDKLEKRSLFQDQVLNETINFAATVGKDLKDLNKMLGVKIQLPDIHLNADTWVTLIEQFLMLVLIIGRWMLPKGDLTRDQLSQLLLVYIGTAADIIEFFDSFKDSKIANEPVLVLLTLSIWSWSLLQFTIVLSATRARKPRGGGSALQSEEEDAHCCNVACCNIDVWGIALNILLQDAPFLTFRLLIIIHYKIITYMNIFFTCKNTLVILLQLYRLYVLNSENRKAAKKSSTSEWKKKPNNARSARPAKQQQLRKTHRRKVADLNEEDIHDARKLKQQRKSRSTSSKLRKDTGYSTASSPTAVNQRKNKTKTTGEVEARKKHNKKGHEKSRKGRSTTLMDDSRIDYDLPEMEQTSERQSQRNRSREGTKKSTDRKEQRRTARDRGGSKRCLEEDRNFSESELDNIDYDDGAVNDDGEDDDAEDAVVSPQTATVQAGGRNTWDDNDTSEFEIIHEKKQTGRGRSKKPQHARNVSSTASSSGSTSE